jgi:sporulation protein YlmC with PRC-barrel domain
MALGPLQAYLVIDTSHSVRREGLEMRAEEVRANVIDYEVYDMNGNKIGTVERFWIENDHPDSRVVYIGVKTGWILGKEHVVPISESQIDHSKNVIRVAYPEEKIKDAPAFEENSDLGAAEEREICDFYYGTNAEDAHSGIDTETFTTTGSSGFSEAQHHGNVDVPPQDQKAGEPHADVDRGGIHIVKIMRTARTDNRDRQG